MILASFETLTSFHLRMLLLSTAWIAFWAVGMSCFRIRNGVIRRFIWIMVLATIPLFGLMSSKGGRSINPIAQAIPEIKLPRQLTFLSSESAAINNGLSSPQENVESARIAETTSEKNEIIHTEDATKSDSSLYRLNNPQEIRTIQYVDVGSRIKKVISLLWIVGVFLVLVKLGMGAISLKRISIRARAVTHKPTINVMNTLKAEIGIKRTVSLLIHGSIYAPISYGVFKPKIILPESLREGEEQSHLIPILTHELAHIKRFDFLVTLFQRLLEAVFFLNPAVWYASSKLSLESEIACDDWVLYSGMHKKEYAKTILSLVSNPLKGDLRFANAILGRQSKVGRRIKLILNRKYQNRPRILRKEAVLCLLLIIAVFLPLSAISCVSSSHQYEKQISHAWFQLDESDLDVREYDQREDLHKFGFPFVDLIYEWAIDRKTYAFKDLEVRGEDAAIIIESGLLSPIYINGKRIVGIVWQADDFAATSASLTKLEIEVSLRGQFGYIRFDPTTATDFISTSIDIDFDDVNVPDGSMWRQIRRFADEATHRHFHVNDYVFFGNERYLFFGSEKGLLYGPLTKPPNFNNADQIFLSTNELLLLPVPARYSRE